MQKKYPYYHQDNFKNSDGGLNLLSFENITEVDIRGDGNSFYRTLSQAFFGHQDYHKKIRNQIY